MNYALVTMILVVSMGTMILIAIINGFKKSHEIIQEKYTLLENLTIFVKD